MQVWQEQNVLLYVQGIQGYRSENFEDSKSLIEHGPNWINK